jgi:hypothetical protein
VGLGIIGVLATAPRIGDGITCKNDYNFDVASYKINCSQLSQAVRLFHIYLHDKCCHHHKCLACSSTIAKTSN